MIIDAHTHIGELAAFDDLDHTVDTMLALMDALGIDVCVQMPSAGIFGCLEEAYRLGVETYQHSKGRLVYGLVYDPRYPDASMACFEKALGRPGFVTCKIHPSFHKVWPEDARYERVWRFAAEHNLPVLTHSWVASSYNPLQRFSVPNHFEHYVKRFPEVKLVLGHAGGRYYGHIEAVQLANRYANVFVDISGDSFPLGFIEWLVDKVGAERIMYGSDMNWCDPRTHLGRVYDAEIGLQEKRLILGENACKVYGLDREIVNSTRPASSDCQPPEESET